MTPIRVLIVDDNPMFIETAKFVLAASDTAQALLQIPVFRPGLILMDGIEPTRPLKADATSLAAEVGFWPEGPASPRGNHFAWP